MRKSKKKSFDWYGTRQHFSIRKYHFGAASVLLGMSLALGAGAQVAQAETSAASSETATVASTTATSTSLEAAVAETVATATETATASTTASSTEASTTETVATATNTERSAAINYIVQYVLEDGTVVKADVKLAAVSTTEATAKTSVTVATELPAGYELASGQTATVTQEVTEGAANVVTVKVVKKAEATTTTATTESKATATASSETTTSTETKAATTEAVAETVKTPATVEEAKVVLEQVTSEAEVLSNEAERLVAASDSDNEALKSAAAATKLTATEATAVLNNSTATLEAVNAQIDAVRSNVEALALELRKFLGTDVIQVALTTTTASATVTQSTGNWTENAAVLNKEVAEQEATITPTDEDINSEYKLTEVADYKTFFVVDLSGNQDPTDTSIKSQGSFNYRFDKNWYMRFSTNSTLNDGSVLVELVDRSANHNVVETLTISPGESKQFNNIKTLAASSPIKENKSFQYKITNSEYNFSKDGQTSTLRNLDVYAGIGGTALSTIIYSPASTTIQGSVQNSFSSPIPTSGLDVTTKYVLEKTALKEEKLLATYTLSDANTGDTYTIAGAADFENYELVKTPQSNTGVVGPTYVKGSYVISASWAASHNVVMVQTFSKEDGTSKFLNFALNVDHEDVKEYYKKTDVTAEDLKLEETIAIINDTSLSNEEKLTQIKALNAPFLLMFVSDDVAPRAGNTGPDLLTGEEVWTYTSNRLWIRNKYGAPYGDGKYGPVSNEITNTLFEQNGHPKGMFLPYEYILVNESGQYIDFDGNVHTGSNKTSFGGKRMFMFNEFSPSTGDVTYYYAEKGGVKVYYINEDGDEIATANLVIDHETSGTTFNVKSAEKSEITAADGTVYLFKAIDTNIKKATDPEERFTEKITSYEGAIKVDTVQELTLVYVKQQVGTVKFVDTTDNTVKFTENLSGKTGDEFGFDPAAKIKEFENLGYTVVNKDNYSSTGTFDNIDGNSQDFVFELTPKVSPITPDKPGKPGEPIDPNNPDGPKWPTDKGVDDVTRTISRTVTYVKAEGGEAAPGSNNSVTFERSGEINHVTGEVTWQAWTAKGGDATLEGHPLPTVGGYIAKEATNNGTKVELDSTVANVAATETTGNITEVVTYVKLGSWIPKPPTGTIEVPSTVYPNDPTDPTKPGTEVPTIPHVPGYVPVGPDGTTPLTPVDPADPTKGYEAPPVPSNPGTDTPINYVPEESKVVVRYVDENGNDLVPSENIPGKVGDDYTTSGKVINGYILEKVEGTPSGKIPSGGTTVTYVYKKLGSWVPNIPGQPTDPIVYPNDPTDPSKPGTDVPTIPHVPGYVPVGPDGTTPLTLVDPADPTKGYEAPPVPSNPGTDTPINYVPEESTVVVRYVDENGKELVPSENIPGKVGDDYTTSGKVINGYILEKVEGTPSGKIPSGGTTVTYIYKELGSWIPNIPGQPTEPIVYPNDPTDPSKPGTDVPTIPHVPGYVPVGPDGTTPLTPVDPADPTKGYEAPPVPSNPGTDTPINYVPEESKVVVRYVDENGNDLVPSENIPGKVGDDYTTSGKVINGYILEKVEGNPNGKIPSGGTTVTYVYKKLGSWVPNIPGQPTDPIVYPNDPTDPSKPGTDVPTIPHVPGYVPVGPDGTTPLTPVDPADPTKGYEAPPVPSNPGTDTPINYVPVTPDTPAKPEEPAKPTPPAQPVTPETPAKPAVVEKVASPAQAQLPNTGEDSSAASVLGAAMLVAALALVGKRRRNED